MSVDINDFLEGVVQGATQALQLQDSTTGTLATADPTVAVCARIAYGHITGYLNRKLIKNTYTEIYRDVDDRVKLRCTPIVKVNSVYAHANSPNVAFLSGADSYFGLIYGPSLLFGPPFPDNLLVADKDYALMRKSYIVLKNRLPSSAVDAGTFNLYDLQVEYVGGYTSASDNIEIESALIMQTLATYKRKDVLGTALIKGSEYSGSMTMVASNPDAGDLLESVKTMLSSYVYYGRAEELE